MDTFDNIDPLEKMGFIRLPKVLSILPFSKSDWWAGVKSGKYPKRYKVGSKTCWRIKDILEYAQQIKPVD